MISRKSNALFLMCALTTWLPIAPLNAAPAQVPMFLGASVEPNVMFTLDDSGSMQWEMMPDSLIWSNFIFPRASDVYGNDMDINYVVSFIEANNIYDKWVRSSAVNKIYYDPAITYRPWSKADGSLMSNASTTCAPHNPANPVNDLGDCRNLTVDNTQAAEWDFFPDGSTLANVSSGIGAKSDGNAEKKFWPAFYYQYIGDSSNAAKENSANYTRVEIKPGISSYTGSADRSDCAAAPSCTYAEEIQNFANWYTYYRSRILLARAGVGRAFAKQGGELRVGFAAINQGSATVDGESSPGALIDGVRKFTGTDRTGFFDSLYGHSIPNERTPLRRALDNVGQYFSRADDSGPWGELPGSNDATAHLTCRQSYNILMTDGYWNGEPVLTSGATNADNVAGLTITGPDNQSYQYTPSNPYQGLDASGNQQNNTLADVAMYYWNRDLRPDIDNRVPTNPVDEAFWQHLVNFTVGLGVMGTLDPDTDLPGLTAGTTKWPIPSGTGEEENIDDLWHAAVNSRGGFFSAGNPDEFATRLADSLSQIVGRIGASAAVATNSTRLNSDTFVYQARFDSADWTGQLLGFKITSDGLIEDGDTSTPGVLDPYWEAGTLLDNRASARKIFTHEAADSDGDGNPGVDFLWDANLPSAFKTFLNTGPAGLDALGEKRLQFIRGARTQELPAGVFRTRSSILSDIVNSDPTYVGLQDYGYNLLPGSEGTEYITYRASSAYKNRPGVVYVGANDGMLHAFRGDTGEELFAFIPESVLPDLWRLSDPAYSHRFYVDGAPTGKDAYLNSSWRSVLVGSTGAGGKSVFALDVTDPDPTSFSKTNVLWEFSSSNDSDLGYTIGQPSIVRLANGAWGAVFGNGYDSANQRAVLFIVDIATGNLIKKIDTGVGDATSPNGLASPLVVDSNGDRIGDRIYAGDLHGNLWAFDISDTATSKWVIGYKSGSNTLPLFTTQDEDGNPQPITAKPQAGKHPKGGVMVYFGTGKYFEPGDGVAIRKNSFYGLWDDFSANNAAPIASDRSSLLQQVITHETYPDASNVSQLSDGNPANDIANPFAWDVRVTTENTIDWQTQKGWYLDLESPLPFRSWEGERVVSTPLLLEQRIVFTTVITSLDACVAGGESWLMELSSLDGARLSVTPFDLSGDELFNQDDYVEIWIVDANNVSKKVKIPASGKRSKVGIIKTPAVIKTKEKEFKFTSGSSGEIERTLESRSYREGRQSWRQLR